MVTYLKLELSMPNVGSWNGKWTGKDRFYARTKRFSGKDKIAESEKILANRYYRYDFGDGWSAGVSVEKIDGKEATKVNKKTSGFCGYDWMIDSIINFGEIKPPDER